MTKFNHPEFGLCYEVGYTIEDQFDKTNPETYDKETGELKMKIFKFYSKLLNILDRFISKFFDYNINIAFAGNEKRPEKLEGYFDIADNYIKYIKPVNINVEIKKIKDNYNQDAYILKINKK